LEESLPGAIHASAIRWAIIVRLDAGFFDEKNFALFDDLGIGFLATGKIYDCPSGSKTGQQSKNRSI